MNHLPVTSHQLTANKNQNHFKPVKIVRWIVLLGCFVTLTACGVVAVQIEEPIPTPTLVNTPVPPPAIQAESAAGLVAHDAPDDNQMLVKTIAIPHIVYETDGLAIEMFEQWAAPVEYMIVDKGRGLRLRVNWSALWLANSSGVGRVWMDVYLLSPGQTDFQIAQSASSQDFEAADVNQRDELLDSTLYLPASGDYRIRAEVNVYAKNDKGKEDMRSSTYETSVVALDSPPKILDAAEDFTPQFGDLENQNVLLDWRAWRLGPCLIRPEQAPNVAEDIAKACVGVANANWRAAADALMSAVGKSWDNIPLRARLYQQAGMLAAVLGDGEKAVEWFQDGLNAARRQNDALEVAIALHNLGIAQKTTGDDVGEQNMWQSIQLTDELEDWAGSALTYAQFGYYWQSIDTLTWVKGSLNERGLPQATTVERWLNGFAQPTPTSTPAEGS